MELKKVLKDLGKLNQQEKETYWKNSISGSQAWLLINEPYNLIRDKLGKERIHKSKYDFFNIEKVKDYTENAKLCGILYEKVVIEELKLREGYEKLEYNDHTYRLYLYDKDNKELPYQITSTPDYLIKDNKKNVILVGDIKCSTQADNQQVMSERYYYQLLHNCYVLNCLNAELDAKGITTKPLNQYKIPFTQEQLKEYENKLLVFMSCLFSGIETAYDTLAQNKIKVEKEIESGEVETIVADTNSINNFNNYLQIKQQHKELEEQIKTYEEYFKNSYENTLIDFGTHSIVIKSSSRKGNVDYDRLLSDLKVDEDTKENYRKETTTTKSFRVMEN